MLTKGDVSFSTADLKWLRIVATELAQHGNVYSAEIVENAAAIIEHVMFEEKNENR